MNKNLLIVVWIIFSLSLTAQDQITLDQCYEMARVNYPISQQAELLTASNELAQDNLNKNYLPQMKLNGQVHYQSDVTQVPIPDNPLFDIDPLDKDWYKLFLDVNQVIYDGGATSRHKKVEDINHEISQQNLEIELYSLKQRIKQVYFSVLLLKKNRQVLDLHYSTMETKLNDVKSGVKNGIVLASNEDILKAELLNVEQALDEVEISIQSAVAILGEYTGLNLKVDTELQIPEPVIDLNNTSNNRPELALFSLQQKKIDLSKDLVGSKNMPMFSAFGQAGYGRPGFDMLKNDFDDFYMVGARLSWNFWDWNKTKKEKEVLDLQYEIIGTQKQTLNKNLRIDRENKIATIRKKEIAIGRDKKIIELRERIAASASSQLDNGTITSTEYLMELNSESKARLDLELHKIELVKAKLDYLYTLGNL